MEPNELPDFLAGIRQLNTYRVPAGYFEGLADDILAQVNIPLSATTPLSEPPANYFDHLADSILLKIKQETLQSEVQKELEEIDPFVAGVNRTNVYTVPQGYFDTFTVVTPVQKKEAPVVSLHRPAKWIAYAAAAVVTGIIAMGIIFFTGKYGDTSSAYNTALAKVTDNELASYLDNAPNNDFEVLPAANDESRTGTSEGLYKSLLNNISDNDLQNYLNENDNSNEQNSKGI